MKTGKFEYKCRRCGEIDINPCTSPDNARMILMHILYGWEMAPNFFSIPPEIRGIHHCKDDGCGVSDLIGYRVVEE